MKERFNFNNITDFVGEDKETVKEMIDIFLQTVPESLELLNESFQNKDYRKLSYYAHKLKSSVDLLNIDELRQPIRNIENNANKMENLNDLNAQVEHLNKVLSNLLPKIKEEKEGLI